MFQTDAHMTGGQHAEVMFFSQPEDVIRIVGEATALAQSVRSGSRSFDAERENAGPVQSLSYQTEDRFEIAQVDEDVRGGNQIEPNIASFQKTDDIVAI